MGKKIGGGLSKNGSSKMIPEKLKPIFSCLWRKIGTLQIELCLYRHEMHKPILKPGAPAIGYALCV